MKNIFITLISFGLLSFSGKAHAQSQVQAPSSLAAPYESIFVKHQQLDQDGTELYQSNYDLKKHKKIGAGLSLGGASGVLGVNAEINLAPAETLVIGMGTGPSYGTFNI